MTLQLDIPRGLELSEFDIVMNLAAKLFDRGIVSSGQAAKMVGISKRTFIEIVGNYGVSIFQYEEGEFEKELDNL